MSTSTPSYRSLVDRQAAQRAAQARPSVEDQLDEMIQQLKDKQAAGQDGPITMDPIKALQESLVSDLIPVFINVSEKYAKSGIAMEMDASRLLEGGREIRFDFAVGDYRTQLIGTVTPEMIAFHEVRYAPHLRGELHSGPVLRLRSLTRESFRDFLCCRLMLVIRMAMHGP